MGIDLAAMGEHSTINQVLLNTGLLCSQQSLGGDCPQYIRGSWMTHLPLLSGAREVSTTIRPSPSLLLWMSGMRMKGGCLERGVFKPIFSCSCLYCHNIWCTHSSAFPLPFALTLPSCLCVSSFALIICPSLFYHLIFYALSLTHSQTSNLSLFHLHYCLLHLVYDFSHTVSLLFHPPFSPCLFFLLFINISIFPFPP